MNRAQDKKKKNNETHANNNETTEQSLQCGQPKAQNHRGPALFFLKSLWAQWEQLLGLRLLGLKVALHLDLKVSKTKP